MPTIAFLTTSAFQLHHYAAISRHLDPADVTYVIEHRQANFGLTGRAVEAAAPRVDIDVTTYESVGEIDGRYDVIVCQTPVLPNRLPTRSRVVAQQYSLAKTGYQLGVWRSLCSMNLMYGPHSANRISGFAPTSAVGNPLFDDRSAIRASDRTAPGLYLPTHGSPSSTIETLDRLAEVDAEFVVKLHHVAASDPPPELPPNCTAAANNRHPIDLIAESAFVVSEFSGAAYDAVAANRPLLLTHRLDPKSADYDKLGPDERIGHPLSDISADWLPGRPLADALAEAVEFNTRPGAHETFVNRYYSNFGMAGLFAAEAIVDVAASGGARSFSQTIVRDHVATSIVTRTSLAADKRRLEEANTRLRSKRQRATHSVSHGFATTIRPLVERSPRVHRWLGTKLRHIRSLLR